MWLDKAELGSPEAGGLVRKGLRDDHQAHCPSYASRCLGLRVMGQGRSEQALSTEAREHRFSFFQVPAKVIPQQPRRCRKQVCGGGLQ